jgi:hypothetical protein
LTAICLHAAFLRHAGGLWRDEVNTVNLAGLDSLGEMANDSFPILMALGVRGWLSLGLGRTDAGLRCLGAVVGLGILTSLWLVAWTARRSPPTLSLALFALNGTVIVYGDSLRPFGLGSLLVLLLLAAIWAFLRNPSWIRTGLLAAAAVLAVQALFQNAIFVAAGCAGGWTICCRRRAPAAAAKIMLAALIAGSSLLPYWSRILPLASSSPASGIATLRSEFRPALALANLGKAAGFPLPPYIWIWGFFSLAVVVLAIWAWRRESCPSSSLGSTERDNSDLPVLAAVTLLFGLVGFAAFLWWAALPVQPWYFLPPMALAAACFELSVPVLPRRLYCLFMTFITTTALLAFPFAWRQSHWRFTNVDLVARRLAAQSVAEDFILVTPWNRGISFARYFHGPSPWETTPPLGDHLKHRYDLLQMQTQAKEVMQPVLAQISTTLRAGNRVWVVVGGMDIPLAPAPVEADLDPPPLKHTGWSTGPYVRRWTAQATQFLRNHSRRFAEVPLNNPEVINSNEELELWVAEGWQEP